MKNVADTRSVKELAVQISAGDALLSGQLQIPNNPKGLILFVHGSGSSRFSPRNQYVAELFNQAGLATILFDLLTAEESQIDEITREYRFDIELLSRRTVCAIDWVCQQTEIQDMSLGLFGASTGAAAALFAAYSRPKQVGCVVSRGGRPDLAIKVLKKVQAPTLLIVGALDYEVIQLNELAKQAMQTECKLTIVQGATHLFTEAGTLDVAATAAKNWFLQKLTGKQ
ncbi:hydrolase [Thiomicrorhabdus immobilis]|uniref:Hydrolase n=1 Tax=Thiomicrorhabdus immobilis TaxID=2791037 RepID=A0ABM7ME19_9GAMM|nr:alpha/beta family hydrolase [Thiomicrorhabdus immobilis]BCN93657.1 hydrolase [Thiomicrorhabdus immobilis]